MTDRIKSAGGVQRYEARAIKLADGSIKYCMVAVAWGDLVLYADHQAAIAALLEVVKRYRMRHLNCSAPAVNKNYEGAGLSPDYRCDLCKRADALLKEVEG
jgi:hypothetical protein